MAEAMACPQTVKTPARKLIRTLTLTAALSGLLIVLVYQLTLPIIRRNQAAALKATILRMRPDTQRIRYFQLTPAGLTAVRQRQEAQKQARPLYVGYNERDELTGVWAEASGIGYQDRLKLLFAIDPRRQLIIGMAVLESKETPGLGDRIEKDPQFQANFTGLDVGLNQQGTELEHEIRTVKKGRKQHPWEIDGITGATISAKAVGRILNQGAQMTLPLVVKNLERLKAGDTGNSEF